MWILPIVSTILGLTSIAMFIWALYARTVRQEARLDATMREEQSLAGTGAPARGSEWAEPTGDTGLPASVRDLPWVDHLQLELLRADWVVRPSEYIAFTALVGLGLAAALTVLLHSPAGALVGIVVGFGGSWGLLKSRQVNRNRVLSAQMPDMLDMLCSSLRAGFSVGQAMHRVHAQTGPPMADEFGRALEEIRFGHSLADALEGMVSRTNNYDLALVVSAIQIQLDVGGNMAEVLDKIGNMIRERVRLKGEITVAASEGRLSSVVLLALPPAMGILIRVLNPHYLDPLLTTPTGKLMLAGGVVLMLVGAWILNRMTAIDA